MAIWATGTIKDRRRGVGAQRRRYLRIVDEGRVHEHTPRLQRDVATTVLLDLSLSADAWVDDRRVLDVEREAAWVLGEVADELGDALRLLAFASNTRSTAEVASNFRDWRIRIASSWSPRAF